VSGRAVNVHAAWGRAAGRGSPGGRYACEWSGVYMGCARDTLCARASDAGVRVSRDGQAYRDNLAIERTGRMRASDPVQTRGVPKEPMLSAASRHGI
jgi:hypothetical protein